MEEQTVYERLREAEPNFVGKQYFKANDQISERSLLTAYRFQQMFKNRVTSIGELTAWRYTGHVPLLSTFITASRIEPGIASVVECEPEEATIELLYVSPEYRAAIKKDKDGDATPEYVAWFLSKRDPEKYAELIEKLNAVDTK